MIGGVVHFTLTLVAVPMDGYIAGEGTHVGVAIYGEFDDNLQWPFKGDIRVWLINQGEGGDDVEEEVVSENCEFENTLCHVLEGNGGKLGVGLDEFISHSDLYKPEEGKEYLKNDTLKFNVSSVTVNSIDCNFLWHPRS